METLEGVGRQSTAFTRETRMAKGQQKGNKEARKPKKAGPPKQNASNPSTKGINSGIGKAGW